MPAKLAFRNTMTRIGLLSSLKQREVKLDAPCRPSFSPKQRRFAVGDPGAGGGGEKEQDGEGGEQAGGGKCGEDGDDGGDEADTIQFPRQFA